MSEYKEPASQHGQEACSVLLRPWESDCCWAVQGPVTFPSCLPALSSFSLLSTQHLLRKLTIVFLVKEKCLKVSLPLLQNMY